MTLQERITLLLRLREYILEKTEDWEITKERAYRENQWFIPEFIEQSVKNIAHAFLQRSFLEDWAAAYQLKDTPDSIQKIGIVMAGNIPLVGFHDLLCVFISGHTAIVKLSSKDEILLKHLVAKLIEWDNRVQHQIQFADRLTNCSAYIATGSNNSSRYFDYYFGKYPNIIRKNRTSIAVLDGTETTEELVALADDAMLFFGLGCRNVTQLYVPESYDFIPLLKAFKKYAHFMEYHKYKHNYDYHLALLIMGGKYYMNNDTTIFTPNTSPFSPVSQLHYTTYHQLTDLNEVIKNNEEAIQCIVGHGYTPFGKAQSPGLTDYPDGVDTMAFIASLSN
jgi:hypothetical protein